MARRNREARKAIPEWLTPLKHVVQRKPLVLFRFDQEEWENLRTSRRGTNAFTFARPHTSLDGIGAKSACLLQGTDTSGKSDARFGLLKSRHPFTTPQSRLKVTCAQSITPSSERALLDLVTENHLKSILRSSLERKQSVVKLSPALSVHLIERLAEQKSNLPALRAVAVALNAFPTYSSNIELQHDAIALSLKTFGLYTDAVARELEVPENSDTGLAGFSILEDAVIEHDARIVRGFELWKSDLTGRAVFKKNNEVLEVITANKRPLEQAFGVDLIYLNAIKRNVVMVQYKMLERSSGSGETDWLYRPDKKLTSEMDRMRKFDQSNSPEPLEYRINPQVFYLRFVRRNARLGKKAVTIPIDHFEKLRIDPTFKGPRGAFRISYDSLDGRYLRQAGFLDLLRSGYIGAYAKTTNDFAELINSILRGGRSVVAAIQSSIPT